MPLSATDCSAAQPRTKPFKLFDGQGLYLLTQPSGRKYWRLKYRFAGKEKLLALGVYPQVAIDAARREAQRARQLLAQSIDPARRRSNAHAIRETWVRPALTSPNRTTNLAPLSIAHEGKPCTVASLDQVPGLDGHLCFALYSASNHMTRLFAPFLKTLGLTYPQYLVLVVLWEYGDQGGADLASTLRMHYGTLSPMLQRLERKSLIARRRDPGDQRRIVVSLTPAGEALRKRTQQTLGEFYCFLNTPLGELFDLKDRLRQFVRTAGTVSLPTPGPEALALQPG